jgi:hypothetical protein
MGWALEAYVGVKHSLILFFTAHRFIRQFVWADRLSRITNRQARDRLPRRTSPRGHPHLVPTLTEETEPSQAAPRPCAFTEGSPDPVRPRMQLP